MNEWGVVGVIVTLAGLAVAIVKPIVQLNTNIVKLTDAVDGLKKAHTKSETDNEKEHKQLHERINHRKKENEELNDRVTDHENRISLLEHK
nr:MAG TPA: hypothetical protein [Caudoviricetes sp.]